MPIARNAKEPRTFKADANGKTATTAYKVVKEHKGYSLLELRPTTGRTHQLRVHLKQLGHPIVGDTVYGGESYRRLLLHAYKLELTLPNTSRKIFESSMPRDFDDIMK